MRNQICKYNDICLQQIKLWLTCYNLYEPELFCSNRLKFIKPLYSRMNSVRTERRANIRFTNGLLVSKKDQMELKITYASIHHPNHSVKKKSIPFEI